MIGDFAKNRQYKTHHFLILSCHSCACSIKIANIISMCGTHKNIHNSPTKNRHLRKLSPSKFSQAKWYLPVGQFQDSRSQSAVGLD